MNMNVDGKSSKALVSAPGRRDLLQCMPSGSLRAAVLAIPLLLLTACGEIHSRADFTTAVISKSADEVTESFGKPKSVDNQNGGRVVWTYGGKTFDLDNQNKRDSKTLVIFEPADQTGALKATKVDFMP